MPPKHINDHIGSPRPSGEEPVLSAAKELGARAYRSLDAPLQTIYDFAGMLSFQNDPPAIDQIIRTRRKTIALIIQPDGRLVVRAPLRASNQAIRLLVQQKAAWIKKKQDFVRATYSPPVSRRFVSGENFYFLGAQYPLEILKTNQPALTLADKFFLSEAALPRAQAHFERWYRQQALHILTYQVQHYASLHGFQYQQVKITSARTRWGSCSTRGTLSFTWRLVMAPMPIIDYVVVHELVHLKIHNHSKKFWDMLKMLLPDYQDRRSWLKEYGQSLVL